MLNALEEMSIDSRGIKTRSTCRVCESPMRQIFSLGEQYISNFLLPEQPDGLKAPLDLVLCDRCHLLQLKHTVSPDAMYKTYWYRSGTNQTMREALADIAQRSEGLVPLRVGDSVLDIGCNDGTLLASYQTAGIYKIGIDPAENLAMFSRKIADKVLVGFFGAN